MFERFTEKARQVVVEAQGEARERNLSVITPDHLLFGLAKVEDGAAAVVLETLGFTPESVKGRLDETTVRGVGPVVGQIPFSPATKKVLENAQREALAIGHSWIGTEHILLSLVRAPFGANDGAVIVFDLDGQAVRNRVIDTLSGRPKVEEVEELPLHRGETPDEGSQPKDWTLAQWQGLMEELHYQADNHNDGLFMVAHDAIRWLVGFYLARR